MVNTAISVQHVTMEFRGERALKDVTHDFEEGKVHGITGGNGSGKTVLLKCICGLLIPTQGKILVDYEQIGRDTDFPADMGLMIGSPGFLPHISGMKNLQYLALHRKKIGVREIIQAIRQVGLDPKMTRHVKKYSPEMRKRLGIAQAIMEDPSLLILDEPLSGLDPQGLDEMRELIRGLRSKGKTILLTSHEEKDISGLCDTVCRLDAGRLEVIQ